MSEEPDFLNDAKEAEESPAGEPAEAKESAVALEETTEFAPSFEPDKTSEKPAEEPKKEPKEKIPLSPYFKAGLVLFFGLVYTQVIAVWWQDAAGRHPMDMGLAIITLPIAIVGLFCLAIGVFSNFNGKSMLIGFPPLLLTLLYLVWVILWLSGIQIP